MTCPTLASDEAMRMSSAARIGVSDEQPVDHRKTHHHPYEQPVATIREVPQKQIVPQYVEVP